MVKVEHDGSVGRQALALRGLVRDYNASTEAIRRTWTLVTSAAPVPEISGVCGEAGATWGQGMEQMAQECESLSRAGSRAQDNYEAVERRRFGRGRV